MLNILERCMNINLIGWMRDDMMDIIKKSHTLHIIEVKDEQCRKVNNNFTVEKL